MKKLIALTLTLAFSVSLFAGNPWSDRTEYRYVYAVNYFGEDYEFSVEITKDNEEGLAFDWAMTLMEGQAGKITMSPEALESGTILHNYFANGSEAHLDDATSVWFSNQVYKLIVNQSPVELDAGYGVKTFSAAGQKEYHLDVDGTHTHAQALVIQSEDGQDKIEVLAASDYNNPLIMGMEFVDWHIHLIRIEKL